MDIARGPRRARHVASNATAGATAGATTPSTAVANTPAVPVTAAAGEPPRAARPAASVPGATTPAPAQPIQTTATPANPLPAQTPEEQHLNSQPPLHVPPRRQPRRDSDHPHRQEQRRQQLPHVTPTYNPNPNPNGPNGNHRSHITPDQLRYHDRASPPGGAGPPVNPFRLNRDTHLHAGPRHSMPFDTDDSGSEPDVSVLAMARARAGIERQASNTMEYDDEVMSPGQYDVEDTSIDEQAVEEEEIDEDNEEAIHLVDPAAIGLKEISNLGRFTVSSHKPGNGVDELRNDDLKLYWQSDGPQPHNLTVYFVKRVGIRDIRFFVDYNEDESYTPTKIVFKSGTSENNLIEFATMNMDSPVGWQQVPIAGAGGEPDGNTLVSYVLQMQILENHQNGKDTHLRGIKIYAFDADTAHGASAAGGVDARAGAPLSGTVVGGDDDEFVTAASGGMGSGSGDKLGDIARALAAARLESGEGGFSIPDFMREPEIR